MVSNVVIVGVIGEVIEANIRLLSVERPYRSQEGQFIVDNIPISYWTRATNNYFMNMKNGTLILIKGRIETLKDGRLIIVCDHLETLLPAKS